MSRGYIRRNELLKLLDEDTQEAHTTEWFRELVNQLPDASGIHEIEWTEFETVFGGIYTRQVRCGHCGNVMVELVDKPFDACPYCFARRANHDR
jgi:hypothetical protein